MQWLGEGGRYAEDNGRRQLQLVMTSCSAGAALVCYMVSSVEGEGKIEGYHGVYGGKLQCV